MMNMNSKFLLFVVLVLSISLVPSCVGQDFIAEFKGKVDGRVRFYFHPDEDNLMDIVVDIRDGLEPGIGHPFHVHEFNVKIPGNCSSAGPHLDPTLVGKVPPGQTYKCDPTQLDKCEVGDLSGKYGPLIPNGDGIVQTIYHDHSLKPNGDYGIAGRSVVVHLPDVNRTRLDCADIISLHNQRRRLNRLSRY